MKRSKVSRFYCYVPLIAAIVTIATGCDGAATVSSPFAVQQTAPENVNTSNDDPINGIGQSATEQDNSQQNAPQQSSTQQSVSLQTATQPVTTTQNDSSTTDSITTVEQPAQQVEQQPQQPAAISNPTPADITDLILVTGQSNALGADTAFNAALDSPDSRTFAYTDNGWQVADLHQIWDQGWFPRGNTDSDPSNNLSLHFGKRVTSTDPGRVVGFILVTAPGMPISTWEPDGAFFNSIRTKVSNAINELPGKSQIDGILWHQGESDGEDDPAYGTALYALISAFRSESWYGYNRPFICGETATLPVNRQLNRLNSDNDPDTACIAAEGLETRGDDAHFSAAALRTIGRRYADQYLKMTR